MSQAHPALFAELPRLLPRLLSSTRKIVPRIGPTQRHSRNGFSGEPTGSSVACYHFLWRGTDDGTHDSGAAPLSHGSTPETGAHSSSAAPLSQGISHGREPALQAVPLSGDAIPALELALWVPFL